jgi:hypothetical protein
MRRLRNLRALAVALALASAPATLAQATPSRAPVAAAAKTCGAGYTHAVVGGAQKCLRRGEFCSSRYRRQYVRYGYHCIAGRLR